MACVVLRQLQEKHRQSRSHDEERENGALVEADLRDEKLMAVCAALEVFGNKALTAAEIGEACVQHGWIRPR
jgi:hypothetical protein